MYDWWWPSRNQNCRLFEAKKYVCLFVNSEFWAQIQPETSFIKFGAANMKFRYFNIKLSDS